MNQHNILPEALEHSSNLQIQGFEYEALEAETRLLVLRNTNEIKTLMRRTCEDIINIGHKLIAIKMSLGHGKFINWLKFEFNWSVSTATKFMQVADQFKFVNFTNLNITASALYLIAAPSTPNEVRAEVLRIASLGENITYTKAKQIIRQNKNKNLDSNFKESVAFDTFSKTTKCNSRTSTEKAKDIELSNVLPMCSTIKNFSGEKAIDSNTSVIEGLSLFAVDKAEEITTNTIMSDDFTFYHASDVVISEIAAKIKNLTPEQLAVVIAESAKSGLSDHHLNFIIMASQQVLNARQSSQDEHT
ncbi:MAG: DUF3102 domain-containing protein [Scytonematopsis contorta HA4267-MV1]|jgi:hypothetical protein|nr:DUF3102 domain-containing protein [Scytonematopsis contorta HA4267-MV1]